MTVATPLDFKQTMTLLRALAEPTRYRLLAVLQFGELTVGEIADVLEQSQPRISRHLKLLSAVGALEWFREEQRTYYRLTAAGTGAPLVRQVLQQVDSKDPVLAADQQRLRSALRQRVRRAGADWQDVRRAAESMYGEPRLVKAILKEVGDARMGDLLDVGTGSGSFLRVLAGQAERVVGLDMSTPALRVARAKVHGAGFSHCKFHQGDMYKLPFAAQSFDAVTFDHVLSAADKPQQALREAAKVLRSGGRVIVMEDVERLPEATLVQWLDQAGLQVGRRKPLAHDGQRLLLMVAQREKR